MQSIRTLIIQHRCLRPDNPSQLNCNSKFDVTFKTLRSVHCSTRYGRPWTFPVLPDMRMKLLRMCRWSSLTPLGNVTAHEATRSGIRSPSKSGKTRGSEILTSGIWWCIRHNSFPTKSNIHCYDCSTVNIPSFICR